MKKEEVNNIVKLRQKVLEFYQGLDGRTAHATAVMKQADTALMLETIVRSIDDLLSEHVKFE